MRSPARTFSLLIAAGAAASAAQAQDYSNTLGVPGLTGSYTVGFEMYDDGTGPSMYTTGQFSIPGATGGSNIARWDGSAWQPVGGGLVGAYSNAIKAFNGDLIAAGYFDSANGVAGSAKLARWDGTEWHSMDAQSEIFLNSFWDLEVYDDGMTGEQLYIAGNYGDLNGNTALDHIAKWDGTTYSEVGGTIGGAVPLIVLDLLASDFNGNNLLYAGGRFLTIGGVSALNVAVWDGTAWDDLDGGLSRTSGFAQVLHMTSWDDGSGPALYVGGRFNLAAGNPVSTNIAKWDGTSWSSMGSGFDADVHELVVFDDGNGEALYALGSFTMVGSRPTAGIAKWNGSDWEAVGDGANDTVFGGGVFDYGEGPALVLAGSFTNVGGLNSSKVGAILAADTCPADINGDGSLDFFDVSAFLAAFAAEEPAADFNGDGSYDFFDVSAFLGAFSAGC
ncbi:MAG: GC-type dockerin domain-anchored protein [Phycisphaerales bacterium JB047]